MVDYATIIYPFPGLSLVHHEPYPTMSSLPNGLAKPCWNVNLKTNKSGCTLVFAQTISKSGILYPPYHTPPPLHPHPITPPSKHLGPSGAGSHSLPRGASWPNQHHPLIPYASLMPPDESRVATLSRPSPRLFSKTTRKKSMESRAEQWAQCITRHQRCVSDGNLSG